MATQNKKDPRTAPDVYGAGRRFGDTLGREISKQGDFVKRGLASVAAPAVVPAAAGGEFVRGLAGATPSPPSAPKADFSSGQSGSATAQVAGAPSPNFQNVRGGSSSSAAPPPGSPQQVLGTFNGRQITRGESDRMAGQLPVIAGAPVMTARGFAGAAPSANSAATPTPAQAVPGYQRSLDVAPIQQPSINTGRVADAERERAALVSSLDNQIGRMEGSSLGLNSRGKRQLYADLLAQRAGLTRQVGDLAGRAAESNLDAATRAGIATQGETGQNARAQLADAGATTRTLLGEVGATDRATYQQPQYQTASDGRVVVTQGRTFMPVTDAAGNELRGAPTRAEGAITPQVQLDALVKQLQGEQGALQPNQARVEQLQQQISALTNTGGTAATPPAVGAVVKGYRFKGGDPADQNNWEKVN